MGWADGPRLRRRSVLVAGFAATAVSGPAQARSGGQIVAPQGSPLSKTIASPLQEGFTYRTLSYIDFIPRNQGTDTLWFDEYGMNGRPFYASIEIPHGVLFREVEWYAFNGFRADMPMVSRLWTPASGVVTDLVTTIAPRQGKAVAAYRSLIDPEIWGPYPLGSCLHFFFDGAFVYQSLNGVRVGFSRVRGVPNY